MKLGYNQAREHQPHQQPEQTSGVCIKLPPVTSFCPAEDEAGTAAEAKRSDDDLRAQQEMADWAFVVAIAGAVGLTLSAAGVGLVYATFRKTADAVEAAREANETARQVAVAELRAYVQATELTISDFVVGRSPKISYQAKNVGQTPAFQFRHITQVRQGIDVEPETDKLGFGDDAKTPFPHVDIGGGGAIEQSTELAPLTQEIYDEFMSGQRKLLYGGVIWYRDVFGRQRRTLFRAKFSAKRLKNGSARLSYCTRNNRSS